MIFSGTAAFLVGNICLLILWSVALLRTGLGFLYIIVFSAVLSVVFSIIQLVLYYNPPFIFQTLSRDGYQIFYYAFVSTQIFNVVINIIGITLLVRWICRVHVSRGCSEAL
jgi:heme/copper-type cytochrome/quinol oxidase subunit 3